MLVQMIKTTSFLPKGDLLLLEKRIGVDYNHQVVSDIILIMQ